MINAVEIREYLIERLELLFGEAKNADALSAELLKHAPNHATMEGLSALADRLIETRKTKGFPSIFELIKAIRTMPPPRSGSGKSYRPDDALEKRRQEDIAEANAIRLLAGTELARRAVEDKWAPGLIQFAERNGRAPILSEEGPIIRLCHSNNYEVATNPGIMGMSLVHLRAMMHWKAAKQLGFPYEMPVAPPKQKMREMATKFDAARTLNDAAMSDTRGYIPMSEPNSTIGKMLSPSPPAPPPQDDDDAWRAIGGDVPPL